MSISLTLASLWVLVACIAAMLPGKHSHWRTAYALIAVGIPLLGYITLQHGPWVGLLCMIAAASILRWPLIYAVRWVRQRFNGGKI